MLFVLWFILNGRFSLQIFLFGVLVCAAAWLLLKRILNWNLRKELCLYRLVPYILYYICLLVFEILKANLIVISLVFSRRQKPAAVLVTFYSGLRSKIANAALANSITLTPGTITVYEEDGLLTVHCLCEKYAEGIDSSGFIRLLKQMEELICR